MPTTDSLCFPHRHDGGGRWITTEAACRLAVVEEVQKVKQVFESWRHHTKIEIAVSILKNANCSGCKKTSYNHSQYPPGETLFTSNTVDRRIKHGPAHRKRA